MSLWGRGSSLILSRSNAAVGVTTNSLALSRLVTCCRRQAKTPIGAHTTRRTFAKETSASDLHAQMSQTLSKAQPSSPAVPPPPPPGVDPNAPKGLAQQIFRHPERRTRYHQAMWNAGAAFMLMIMAAQSFKSGRERRRVSSELAAVERVSAQRLALLQALFDEATVNRIVEDIVKASEQEKMEKDGNSGSGSSQWFGRSGGGGSTRHSLDRQQVANVLLQNFDQLVGDAVLDDAQREALRMRLEENQAPRDDTNALIADNSATPTLSESPKRVPFTM